MMEKGSTGLCPAANMLNLLGQRHVLVVLYTLRDKAVGFNDLQESLHINTATLTGRLSTLEESGLIEKISCKEDSRRHYYSLTKRGKKLSNLINKLGSV